MRILLSIFAALIALPANADWQYTKWGMTPDEVIAVTGPTARRGDWPEESTTTQQARVKANYRSQDIDFRAVFYFSPVSAGLMRVVLNAMNVGDCGAARGILFLIYGKPIETPKRDANLPKNEYDDIIQTDHWRDERGQNSVIYGNVSSVEGGECSISYSRLWKAGDKGGL